MGLPKFSRRSTRGISPLFIRLALLVPEVGGRPKRIATLSHATFPAIAFKRRFHQCPRNHQNPQVVNQPIWTGESPITSAANGGKWEVAEFLLTNGANVDTRGLYGQTPLYHAAFNGDAKMVRLLLSYKADINAKDEDNNTPVMYSYHNVEVLKLMLAAGGNVNAT